MIWALHGNFGAPFDWSVLARSKKIQSMGVVPVPLWQLLRQWPIESLVDFAVLFNQYVQQHDDSPTLLGYSLGGRLGLHAIQENPGLWKGAIFFSTHQGLRDEESKQKRRETDWVWADHVTSQAPETTWKQWNELPLWQGRPSTLPSDPVATLREWAPEIARGFQIWSLGRQDSLHYVPSAFGRPVLWLCGELDTTFRQNADNLKAPDVTVEIIPGAGHRLPWDTPESCLPILEAWYEKQRFPGRGSLAFVTDFFEKAPQ